MQVCVLNTGQASFLPCGSAEAHRTLEGMDVCQFELLIRFPGYFIRFTFDAHLSPISHRSLLSALNLVFYELPKTT